MDFKRIERILGVYSGYLEDPENRREPEIVALLRMVECMPWLLKVAESGFNPEVAKEALAEEARKIEIEKMWKSLGD